jgi:hypothetical protein
MAGGRLRVAFQMHGDSQVAGGQPPYHGGTHPPTSSACVQCSQLLCRLEDTYARHCKTPAVSTHTLGTGMEAAAGAAAPTDATRLAAIATDRGCLWHSSLQSPRLLYICQ